VTREGDFEYCQCSRQRLDAKSEATVRGNVRKRDAAIGATVSCPADSGPRSCEVIRERTADMTEEERNFVLHDNLVECYGLNLAS
jgi:hypothetical protein